MVYVDTPISTDDQDVSAPQMRANFLQANTSFGFNHYPFSDLTANNGKHNNIQTPLIVGGVHPSTAAGQPSLYAMQDSSNLGVLQYSLPGNSTAMTPIAPTPLTNLQSPKTAIMLASLAETPILDFTGINIAIADFRAFDSVAGVVNVSTVFWSSGVAFFINPVQSAFLIQLQGSGNILQLKNNATSTLSNIYWTLKFHRIQ